MNVSYGAAQQGKGMKQRLHICMVLVLVMLIFSPSLADCTGYTWSDTAKAGFTWSNRAAAHIYMYGMKR
jgi:hypothetical protein